jgi:hypothetical protein
LTLGNVSFAQSAEAQQATSQARESAERTELNTFEVEGVEFRIDAPEGQEGRRERVARAVREEWPQVAARLKPSEAEPITIHLEKNLEDFFDRRQRPYRSRHWVGGLAIPSERIILLEVGDSTWRETLVHELIHLAQHSVVGDNHIPRWYNEGVAIIVSGVFGIEETEQLLKGAGTSALLPFSRLDRGVPSGTTSAQIAYAQSYRAVADLEREFGRDFHHELLSRIGDGVSFRAAFFDVTGVQFSEWEDEWMAQWESPFAFFRGVNQDFIWAIAALFGAVALVITRWRHVRERREMDDYPYPVKKSPSPEPGSDSGSASRSRGSRSAFAEGAPPELAALGVSFPQNWPPADERLESEIDDEWDEDAGQQVVDVSRVGAQSPQGDGPEASGHHRDRHSGVERRVKDTQDQDGSEGSAENRPRTEDE